MAKPATLNVQTFMFKRGKIRINYDTGFVTDQKGRRLAVDETIHEQVGFEVPDVVMDEIQKAQDALEAKYYDKEIQQAMQEAKAKKLAEIRERKKSKSEKKPVTAREDLDALEEDYDDFDEEDFKDLEDPPARNPVVQPPAKKNPKKKSVKKKS